MQISGVGLEYAWIGPKPGKGSRARPTLVLLHEGLGCVSMWRDFPERLSEATGCGVLVFSRRGYGKSDPAPLPRPLSYMHDEAFEMLGPVLDHFAIERTILVGHSDGASIATIYAGGVGDHRVRGLVLMAPHFIVEDICVNSIAEAKTTFETTDLRDRLARHHGKNVDCAFWGWNRVWLESDFRKWDIREYLPYIRVPMLIIQGETDEYGTALQIEIAREECYCPVESALLPDCGHAPFRDQPEATLAAARDFILHLIAIETGEREGVAG
jgi:pimeloyl-ACP methyl ester carboxylesterase